jgi:hypothetical protein
MAGRLRGGASRGDAEECDRAWGPSCVPVRCGSSAPPPAADSAGLTVSAMPALLRCSQVRQLSLQTVTHPGADVGAAGAAAAAAALAAAPATTAAAGRGTQVYPPITSASTCLSVLSGSHCGEPLCTLIHSSLRRPVPTPFCPSDAIIELTPLAGCASPAAVR